ncbi:MAG: DNA-protecting protein DprA [Clostridiales bacterium]|nr:DNA-protecting protein DprA [Clostridiales bacterium]
MYDPELWLWFAGGFMTGGRQSDALLAEYGGDVETIYKLGAKDYIRVTGSAATAKNLSDKSLIRPREILAWCKENGVSLMTPDNPLYPQKLRLMPQKPIALYYKGNFIDFDAVCSIGMVGTRSMSEYGRQSAYTIALELARCGAVVVSGMAAGIDGVSHRGALDGGGYTAAILGCGIDRPYPEFHADLMAEIAEKGCVITEYPPFTPPRGLNFPARNRIISGLSSSVFIVEGSRKSGAMITARAALFQGRDLCALPGKIGETNSEGPNELLRQGARLASCAGDILKIYSLSSGIDLSKLSFTPEKETRKKGYSPSKPADKKTRDPAESREIFEPDSTKIETAGKQDRYAEAKTSETAKAVSEPKEIAAEKPKAKDRAAALLTDDELAVWNAMGDGICMPDTLFEAHGGSRVLTLLSLMEIKGVVCSTPGGGYKRI